MIDKKLKTIIKEFTKGISTDKYTLNAMENIAIVYAEHRLKERETEEYVKNLQHFFKVDTKTKTIYVPNKNDLLAIEKTLLEKAQQYGFKRQLEFFPANAY